MISALGIGLFIAATSVQGQSSFETTLAWGGAISAETFTELSISVDSDPGSSITVSTTSGSATLQSKFASQENREASGWMPIRPYRTEFVALNAKFGNAPRLTVNAGQLNWVDAPTVLVGEAVVENLDTMPARIVVAASDLPRLASAYAHIRLLAIDGSALAQLDEGQLRALLEHVGNCGRMLLVDATPAVQRTITRRAGCGGNMLMTGSNGPTLESQNAELSQRQIRSLPATNILGTLIGKQWAELRLITLFLAGFIMVFVLLISIPRTRVAALAFCLLGTGLAATLWISEPRHTFVAWSEVTNGDRIARYAAIERLTASTRGQQTLQPQSLARSPREISGQRITVHWSAAPDERQLDWRASLLEEAQLVTAGSFPVEPNLRAGFDGKAATVCNHGAATSPPSYLRWQGTTYAVPALAPAAKWSQTNAIPITERRPELRLLARRMQRHSLALLQPLRVPANGGEQHAWLMRLESDTPEASPCLG